MFGRDVSKIPCFRNSFLYGIYSGFGGGLITFFLTSRTKFATDVAVASFAIVTLSYWCHCRYQYSVTKFEYAQLKAGMRSHLLYEGTEKEKALQESTNTTEKPTSS